MEDSERMMELEALSAIFVEGEELEIINENEIMLTCGPQGHDGSKERSMKLKFTLPDLYPVEESLQYEIFEDVGIDEETRRHIITVIDDVIKRNQGAPMVYPIVEAVNEELVHCTPLIGKDGANTANSKEEDLGDEFDGQLKDNENLDTGLQLKQLCSEQERVTQQMFEEWSKNFRLQMISKGIWRDLDVGKNNSQMTGRQIFESKLVNVDFDENENVFWNNEALYEGDCDEDALD